MGPEMTLNHSGFFFPDSRGFRPPLEGRTQTFFVYIVGWTFFGPKNRQILVGERGQKTFKYIYTLGIDSIWNFGFCSYANSTMQRGRALQWPESVPAGNPRSRMKFMHIKFISDKNFFCCTHTEQHFATRSVPQKRFLSIFWQNF